MLIFRFVAYRFLLGFCLAGTVVLPASAVEKGGMPDLSQEEQTCLPTSTANLIIWFGKHGYPKLLQSGATEEERDSHTLHIIMQDTDARYDLGTRTDAITYGIEKYIRDAGYSCDVEYRGLDWSQAKFPEIVKDDDGDKYKKEFKTPSPFTQDWLQENNDPNKGFILLLAYTSYDRGSNLFRNAINAGHAVTLVNAEPDMILIHDPAHYDDQPGRKILTPEVLTGGSLQLPGYLAPVSGLMLLSGSLMRTPRNSEVMLTGAVCITMRPDNNHDGIIVASAAGAPNATIGGNKDIPASSKPSAPASAPSSPSTSWAMWLFDLFFKK